jgi:acetyltransferase-like isoleucine patch superfamily enzyme
MSFLGSLIKKIGYSHLLPKGFLRFCNELLLIPAMWLPGSFLREFFNRLRGVTIGKKVWIGPGAVLGQHPFLLTIKDRVIISGGVKILTHDTSFTLVGGKDLTGEIIIGNNVHLGENAVILPGVHIGDNCVVGANTLVNKDIAPGQVAVGTPMRILCSIEEAKKKLELKLHSGKYFSTW